MKTLRTKLFQKIRFIATLIADDTALLLAAPRLMIHWAKELTGYVGAEEPDAALQPEI